MFSLADRGLTRILVMGLPAVEPVMVYYVALPFSLIEGGLAPGPAVECMSGAAAIRRAEAMASNQANAGAVAFSRSGDLNLGEFEDAVILKTFGQVPEDFGVLDSA